MNLIRQIRAVPLLGSHIVSKLSGTVTLSWAARPIGRHFWNISESDGIFELLIGFLIPYLFVKVEQDVVDSILALRAVAIIVPIAVVHSGIGFNMFLCTQLKCLLIAHLVSINLLKKSTSLFTMRNPW